MSFDPRKVGGSPFADVLNRPTSLEQMDRGPARPLAKLGRDQLEEAVVGLWRLLDDIDTLDDAAKGDDAFFRKRTRVLQRRRFSVVGGEDFDRLVERVEAWQKSTAEPRKEGDS